LHRSERTHCEQEGVAGKKRGHDQAGLAKHDQEQQQVERWTKLASQVIQMRIEMQKDVDSLLDHFDHASAISSFVVRTPPES
jgi:hypothetical protein